MLYKKIIGVLGIAFLSNLFAASTPGETSPSGETPRAVTPVPPLPDGALPQLAGSLGASPTGSAFASPGTAKTPVQTVSLPSPQTLAASRVLLPDSPSVEELTENASDLPDSSPLASPVHIAVAFSSSHVPVGFSQESGDGKPNNSQTSSAPERGDNVPANPPVGGNNSSPFPADINASLAPESGQGSTHVPVGFSQESGDGKPKNTQTSSAPETGDKVSANPPASVNNFFGDLYKNPGAIAGTGLSLAVVVAVGFVADEWISYQNLLAKKGIHQKDFIRHLKKQLAQPMSAANKATWFKLGFGLALGGGPILALARYVYPATP